MGMSASQARLLSITSRINDVELRSQQIANIKLRLADESEKVSTAYTQALNKQKLTYTTYSTGSAQKIDLTISSLYKPNCPYVLKTSKGQTVIPSDLYNMYNTLVNASNNPNSWGNRYDQRNVAPCNNADYMNAFFEAKFGHITTVANKVMAAAGKNLTWSNNYNELVAELNGHGGGFGTWQAIVQYAQDHNVTVSGLPSLEEVNYYESLFKEFTSNSETTTATSEYVGHHTYAQISRSNMDNFVKATSDILNDPNWLYEAIESGEFMLISLDTNQQISVSGNSSLAIENDNSDIAKAEAEYNAATLKINNKEKKLDMQMKALDTEHSALNAEQDSLKSLIGDNVSKSFNLFS